MDYAAVITDLEQKRGAIDQVLEGFRTLIGMGPTPTVPTRRLHAGNGKAARKSSAKVHTPAPMQPHAAKVQQPVAHRGKLSPEALVRAAALWRDGVTGEKIGAQLGVSGPAIAYQAAKRGWQRAPRKVHLTDPGYVP